MSSFGFAFLASRIQLMPPEWVSTDGSIGLRGSFFVEQKVVYVPAFSSAGMWEPSRVDLISYPGMDPSTWFCIAVSATGSGGTISPSGYIQAKAALNNLEIRRSPNATSWFNVTVAIYRY